MVIEPESRESLRVSRVRPQFEAALAAARDIKARAPHCRVIFTVYEMKRLGRDAAELTALADRLPAHGLVLEMLAGPLPGRNDPSGPGRLLFGFFAAMAEHEKTQAYPEAVTHTHADLTALQQRDHSPARATD
ncbi:recombinase family protein [Streptomyces xanthophaeus]|uniref:recombinase family protein n=1 Tax=Streptomyces xanthophaeus TaxID=67385 RepID=UPI003444A935